MRLGRVAGALALAMVAFAALLPPVLTAATPPDVEARADRDPDPGGNFTLTFTVRSHQTDNYTVIVAPRPEFAFSDLSNGTRTLAIENGSASDFNFEIQVARSASQGTYVVSYTVLRGAATVKMGTVEVKVGSPGSCSSYALVLPVAGLALGLAWARGPRR